MTTERRAGGEVRVAGRTLTGTVMRYGDVSPGFRERFEAGAFAPVPAVALNIQHDRAMTIVPAGGLEVRDGPTALEIRAELPEGAAALVRRGALRGLSVEFRARAERFEAGVRVVERATLTAIGLVDRPAYPASGVEVRARSGRTVRQRIPAGSNLRCECSGVGCKFARFMQEGLQEAFTAAWDEATEVLAVRASYGAPLASKSRGSVRAAMDGNDAVVDVDLPAGPDGDAVLRAVEDTGAVLVRPYLDTDRSEGVEEALRANDGERVMVYRRMRIRSLIVGATDARDGWPEVEVLPTPDELMEGQAAPRRRRIWL